MSAALKQRPKTRERRKYSDQQRADALAIYTATGSLTETSRQTTIPDATLSAWVHQNAGINPNVVKLRKVSEKSLADKFEQVAHDYLERALQKSAIKKTSGYYAVKAATEGTVTANLLKGLPTSITADITNPAERAAKTVDMLAEWKARKQQKVAKAG